MTTVKTIKTYNKLSTSQKAVAKTFGYKENTATALDADDIDIATEMMRSGESAARVAGTKMLQNRVAIRNALKH